MARTTRTNTAPAADLNALIAQAVQAALADIPGASIAIEASETNGSKRKPASRKPASRKPATAAKPKRKPATRRKSGVVTCGQAWEALGADPEFEPRDPNRPATGPQLWNLNSKSPEVLAELLANA